MFVRCHCSLWCLSLCVVQHNRTDVMSAQLRPARLGGDGFTQDKDKLAAKKEEDDKEGSLHVFVFAPAGVAAAVGSKCGNSWLCERAFCHALVLKS